MAAANGSGMKLSSPPPVTAAWTYACRLVFLNHHVREQVNGGKTYHARHPNGVPRCAGENGTTVHLSPMASKKARPVPQGVSGWLHIESNADDV